MKKISALILSLIMCASVLTACGEDDSSTGSSSKADKTDSTAADESKEDAEGGDDEGAKGGDETEDGDDSEGGSAESTADDGNGSEGGEGGESAGFGPLAKAYSDKIASGVFDIEATITNSFTGEMPFTMAVNGSDFHVIMSVFGMNMNIYSVGGETYTVIPATEMYIKGEAVDLSEMNLDAYALDDNYSYIETVEEDGFVIEKYSVKSDISFSGEDGVEVSTDEEASTGTADYYFDADGNLKKVISSSELSGDVTVEFTKLEFDNVTIELPDMEGWTEIADESDLGPVDEVKMRLGMMGITKQMVEDAGYTYEQLAELDDDALEEAIGKIAEDNGISLGLFF